MESNKVSKHHQTLLKISIRQFAHPIWILPTFGFVSCVGWSLLYDFEDSTATHCRVRNYLPSISAAIGDYTPQRYIWRICIGLHSWPRLLMAFLNYSHYASFHINHRPGLFKSLLILALMMNTMENLSLVGLSMVSSSENFKVHEASFILFMVGSISYMLLTCILFKWSRSPGPMNKQDAKSFKYKTRLFIFNGLAFAAAGYFYIRHMSYCEPGMYTGFALAEYCIVLSNIAFHTTSLLWDLGSFTYLEPHRTVYTGFALAEYCVVSSNIAFHTTSLFWDLGSFTYLEPIRTRKDHENGLTNYV